MVYNLLYFSNSTPEHPVPLVIGGRYNFKPSLHVEASLAAEHNATMPFPQERFMILAPLININNGFNLWFLKDARH